MTENNYANLSAQEIAEDILWIEAGPSHVDAAFKALSSLPAGVRKEVVDAIEKGLIEEIKEEAELFKALGPMLDMLGGLGGFDVPLTEEEKKEAALDLASVHSLCQLFNNVAKVKGDEAHPVTKAVVKEIAALSEADYNSPEPKVEIAIFKGYEKGLADAATPKTAPKPAAKKGPKGYKL